MNRQEAAQFALKALKDSGADLAQVIARNSERDELNVEIGEISLFRSVLGPSLSLKAIRGGKMGRSSVNRFDKEAITAAVREVNGLMDAASPDSAYDIGPAEKGSFRHGAEAPDPEAMHQRLSEIIETAREVSKDLILEGAHLDFSRSETTLLNSRGAELHSTQSGYDFMTMFTTKSGKKSSSFNYTFGSMASLDRPISSHFGLAELFRQNAEQTEPQSLPQKFVGDLILTPHCLPEILGGYLSQLGDQSLIAGTSMFKEKLGKEIASPLLTLDSNPQHPEFASRDFFDGEGFPVENMPVITKGVLQNFLLSQYGALKTSRKKARSGGGNFVMAGGDSSLEKMIAGTKRGILLCRFSGARPSDNGDFSGVAKNSYYVEDGKIKFPVSETTVSGNLIGFFSGLSAVSAERLNFGSSLYPWVKAGGVTVSGSKA